MSEIILNMGFCPSCGDVLISTHVHDFRTCSCGKSTLDGGRDYIKFSGLTWIMTIRKEGDSFMFPPHITDKLIG